MSILVKYGGNLDFGQNYSKKSRFWLNFSKKCDLTQNLNKYRFYWKSVENRDLGKKKLK